MSDVTVLESAAQALAYGRAAVRADFKLEAPDEDEKIYVRMFNSRWNAFGQPLSSLLSEFLNACYRSDTTVQRNSRLSPG